MPYMTACGAFDPIVYIHTYIHTNVNWLHWTISSLALSHLAKMRRQLPHVPQWLHPWYFICLTHIMHSLCDYWASMSKPHTIELNDGFFAYILSSVVHRSLNSNYHSFNPKHSACHIQVWTEYWHGQVQYSTFTINSINGQSKLCQMVIYGTLV